MPGEQGERIARFAGVDVDEEDREPHPEGEDYADSAVGIAHSQHCQGDGCHDGSDDGTGTDVNPDVPCTVNDMRRITMSGAMSPEIIPSSAAASSAWWTKG